MVFVPKISPSRENQRDGSILVVLKYERVQDVATFTSLFVARMCRSVRTQICYIYYTRLSTPCLVVQYSSEKWCASKLSYPKIYNQPRTVEHGSGD